jgi:hypothetical protein
MLIINRELERKGLFVEGDGGDAGAGGPGGGEKKDPPAQSWVPSEEFKQFQATMLQQFETLNSAVQSLARAPSAAPAPVATKPRITEEQYEKAVQEGDAKTIDGYINQKIDDVRSRDIVPLQASGMDAIAGLTREIVLDKLPHYKRFKGEIDKYVENLPPAAKMSPVAYKIAHDAVVGQHHDDLVKEATEAAIRKAQAEGGGGSNTPGDAGSGRQTGGAKGKTPTAKEAFGDDAAFALSSVGKDEESFARRLGYKSWADYMALAKKQEEGE